MGVGDASRSSPERPGLHHDGSEYSEGQRQLALGLEDLKFARAIGEGDTPSSQKEGCLERSGSDGPGSEALFVPGSALENVKAQRESVINAKRMSGSAEKRPATPGPNSLQIALSQSDFSSHLTESPLSEQELIIAPKNEGQSTSNPPSSPLVIPSLCKPRHSAPAPLQTEDTNELVPKALPPIGKGLRVLVVDDDMVTRTLMSRLLSRLGCTVTVAENGKVGLEKILNGVIPPEIILGDRRTGMGMSTGLPAYQCPDDKEHIYLYDIVFLDNQMVNYNVQLL